MLNTFVDALLVAGCGPANEALNDAIHAARSYPVFSRKRLFELISGREREHL